MSEHFDKYPVKTNSIKEEFWLFPNPAGDYVIVYYNIESQYPTGANAIYDLKGNLIDKFVINSRENQMVLDMKALPNGIYIVGLYTNDQLLESEKISKGRY